jgi:hypothetical protein
MTHVHGYYRTDAVHSVYSHLATRSEEEKTEEKKCVRKKIYRFIYILPSLLILKYSISCWWCRTTLHWMMNSKMTANYNKQGMCKEGSWTISNIIYLNENPGIAQSVKVLATCWNIGFRFPEGAMAPYSGTTSRPNAELNLLPEAPSREIKRTEREDHSHSSSAEENTVASTSLSHTPSWQSTLLWCGTWHRSV